MARRTAARLLLVAAAAAATAAAWELPGAWLPAWLYRWNRCC